MQDFMFTHILICLALASGAFANCNHDNCYRAFVQRTSSISAFCSTYTKTVNTATTALPTYATACQNLPSRVSSACSCLVTEKPPPPTCTPSPIIDLNLRNGGFNNPAIPVGQKTTNEPPWTTKLVSSASIDFENDGSHGPGYDGGFASFNLDGKAFGSGNMPAPGATAVLSNPISFCEGEQYTISFYARQTHPEAQHCVIEIGWLDSNYAAVRTPELTSTWKHFGPTEFETVGGVQVGTVRNADGSYAANLQIYVSCYGIKGVAPPQQVQVAIDSLIIIPA